VSSELSDTPFEDLVAEMIRRIGDDPDREGLRQTPERVAKSMTFLTRGYQMSPEEVINGALFEETHRNMVMVKDIEPRRLAWSRSSPVGYRCRSA